MPVVITHHEMGIYLGNALGMGFWSLFDPVGQGEAVTFPDEAHARTHIASWEAHNDPAAYEYQPVNPTGPHGGASISDLKGAGLANLLGDMAADFLRCSESVGSA